MSMMRHVLVGFFLIFISLAAGGCSDNVSDRDIEMADLAEVRAAVAKPDTIRLLDPRAPGQFAAGRIPTAINVPLADVSERKDDIDPRLARFKGLIVYGDDPGSGVARATTKRLMRTGYKGVKMFAGGLSEWKSAGLKLEGSPTPSPIPTPTPAGPPTDSGGFGKPPASGTK